MHLASKYLFDDYSDILMRFGDKPCKRLRRILQLEDSFCNETCFSISTNNCYGNNFISLLSALAVARGIGIKRIVLMKNFLFLKRNFTYRDISVEISSNRANCYHWHFYYWSNEVKPLIAKFMPRLTPEFRRILLSSLPEYEVPDYGLVIFLRSGDAFKQCPHKKYGQPPCNFYLDVIRMKNWSKVIIISQDRKNPCVDVINREVGGYKPRNISDDLGYMVAAKNLVIGWPISS